MRRGSRRVEPLSVGSAVGTDVHAVFGALTGAAIDGVLLTPIAVTGIPIHGTGITAQHIGPVASRDAREAAASACLREGGECRRDSSAIGEGT